MFLKIRRLIAMYIDFTIIIYLLFMLGELINIINNIYINIFLSLNLFILIYKLFIYKDCLIGYESIGKKIMKLKIYQDNNLLLNKEILIKRNCKNLKSFIAYIIMVLVDNKSCVDSDLNIYIK